MTAPDEPTPPDRAAAAPSAAAAASIASSRRVGRRALLGWSGSTGVLGLAAGVIGGVALDRHAPAAPGATMAESGAAARLAPAAAVIDDRGLPMGLGRRVPAFGAILAFDLTDRAASTPERARATAITFLQQLAKMADAAATPSGSADVRVDPDATGAASYDLLAASLQITPGLGARLLTACGLDQHRPAEFADLPAFANDRLETGRSGGDLMVQVGAEDRMKLAGAVQEILSYARALLGDRVRLRWSRSGFRNTAAAANSPATTSRNIMGHRDGTNNPPLGSPLWRITVRAEAPAWMAGGSYAVVRQILTDLDGWFDQGVAARDRVIGRSTTTGAPLGQKHEHDPVLLTLQAPSGAPAIPVDAHIRLASATNVDGARIYRRSWSFDDGYSGGRREAGLLFVAWQSDVRQGFIPIQNALVRRHDALNRFTTHVGSAVFAVPARGADDYVGQRLLEA